MRSASLLLLALWCAWVQPAHAATKDELATTKEQIEKLQERKKTIGESQKKLDGEMAGLQKKLIAAAEIVQKNEAELSRAEDALKVLEVQIEEQTGALKKQRKQLGGMVQAALKMSRVPPESMILMPGDTQTHMKAARALSMMQKSISTEAEAIRVRLAEFDRLKEKILRKQTALKEQRTALMSSQKELNAQIAKRKSMRKSLTEEEQKQNAELADLAKKAESLQDLLSSIREQFKSKASAPEVKGESGISGTKGRLRSFTSAKGDVRSPASGRQVGFFGQKSKNETSKGVVLDTRSGASVTAPYDGEVVFSGTFLAYGKMVILRHSDGFHTLLAGLARIDVRASEFLLEGEPIGAMGEGDAATRLYVELRKDNQPIDPSPWIKGIKSK